MPTTEIGPASQPPLSPLLWWLLLSASLALISIGVLSLFNTIDTARLYGVPLPAGTSGDPFVSITGIRDLSAGCLTLAFTLLRDRRALGYSVLLGAIIPLGDGFMVLLHGPSPLPYVVMHWGSAIVCLVLAWILLRPQNA